METAQLQVYPMSDYSQESLAMEAPGKWIENDQQMIILNMQVVGLGMMTRRVIYDLLR
jgi:hypothetical protein